jgi:hypothetical protein
MEECVRCDEWAIKLHEEHSLRQKAETRLESCLHSCSWLESQLVVANQDATHSARAVECRDAEVSFSTTTTTTTTYTHIHMHTRFI